MLVGAVLPPLMNSSARLHLTQLLRFGSQTSLVCMASLHQKAQKSLYLVHSALLIHSQECDVCVCVCSACKWDVLQFLELMLKDVIMPTNPVD